MWAKSNAVRHLSDTYSLCPRILWLVCQEFETSGLFPDRHHSLRVLRIIDPLIRSREKMQEIKTEFMNGIMSEDFRPSKFFDYDFWANLARADCISAACWVQIDFVAATNRVMRAFLASVF